ncbi:hypothetical protein ABKN59_005055 [Abortiporus biennis]
MTRHNATLASISSNKDKHIRVSQYACIVLCESIRTRIPSFIEISLDGYQVATISQAEGTYTSGQWTDRRSQ